MSENYFHALLCFCNMKVPYVVFYPTSKGHSQVIGNPLICALNSCIISSLLDCPCFYCSFIELSLRH